MIRQNRQQHRLRHQPKSDGKLISVAVKQDAEITKANQSVYPNKFTTAGAATGKVMLWDNLNNMVPRAAASIPFN